MKTLCFIGFSSFSLFSLLTLTSLIGLSFATIPTAPSQVFHVDPANEIVIHLPGYDADGDAITVTIHTLPETGSLYQVSHLYEKYGYDPKHDNKGQIDTVPMTVESTKQDIVYVRPEDDYYPANGKYTQFTYSVNDGSSNSPHGVILLTYDNVCMQSTFDRNIEDWTITSNGDLTTPVHDPTRRGELQFYIYGEENYIQTDTTTGDDLRLWYFNAPHKFLGNHWEMYLGELQVTIGAAAGSFTPPTELNKEGQLKLLVLDCARCNNHFGLRLAYFVDYTDLRTLDQASHTFHIPFSAATSGWYKDPRNTNLSWTVPTECDFMNVLSSLSSVQILGDFTKQYESIGIDNVQYIHAQSSLAFNLDCLL